jgi:hypothetical protein
MLLAAETKKKLEVIDVEDADIGEIVTIDEEAEGDNKEHISIEQFLAAGISVNNHELSIGDKRLRLKNQIIKTTTVTNGKVR